MWCCSWELRTRIHCGNPTCPIGADGYRRRIHPLRGIRCAPITADNRRRCAALPTASHGNNGTPPERCVPSKRTARCGTTPLPRLSLAANRARGARRLACSSACCSQRLPPSSSYAWPRREKGDEATKSKGITLFASFASTYRITKMRKWMNLFLFIYIFADRKQTERK